MKLFKKLLNLVVIASVLPFSGLNAAHAENQPRSSFGRSNVPSYLLLGVSGAALIASGINFSYGNNQEALGLGLTSLALSSFAIGNSYKRRQERSAQSVRQWQPIDNWINVLDSPSSVKLVRSRMDDFTDAKAKNNLSAKFQAVEDQFDYTFQRNGKFKEPAEDERRHYYNQNGSSTNSEIYQSRLKAVKNKSQEYLEEQRNNQPWYKNVSRAWTAVAFGATIGAGVTLYKWLGY